MKDTFEVSFEEYEGIWKSLNSIEQLIYEMIEMYKDTHDDKIKFCLTSLVSQAENMLATLDTMTRRMTRSDREMYQRHVSSKYQSLREVMNIIKSVSIVK